MSSRKRQKPSPGKRQRLEDTAPSRSREQHGRDHSHDRASSPPHGAPLVVNGWHLFMWTGFRARWSVMLDRANKVRTSDPQGYARRPDVAFFATVRKLITEDIPRDPADRRFRQGKTLGRDYGHWRRAKFGGRFRLFFRYHSPSKTIIYAWLNDDKTLRKAGSKTDAYTTFRATLERGTPPTDWGTLVAESE